MRGPIAGFAGDGGSEVVLEVSHGGGDFALHAAEMADEGLGARIEGEEMGGAFGVAGEALEAVGTELRFLIVETDDPEDVVDEIELVAAEDGIEGGLGDGFGFFTELAVPGFGHEVAAGIGVVEAAVAGGAGFAFGGSGTGGFLGVPAIGGDFLVGNAGEGHGDQLWKDLARAAVCLKLRTASFSVLA